MITCLVYDWLILVCFFSLEVYFQASRLTWKRRIFCGLPIWNQINLHFRLILFCTLNHNLDWIKSFCKNHWKIPTAKLIGHRFVEFNFKLIESITSNTASDAAQLRAQVKPRVAWFGGHFLLPVPRKDQAGGKSFWKVHEIRANDTPWGWRWWCANISHLVWRWELCCETRSGIWRNSGEWSSVGSAVGVESD